MYTYDQIGAKVFFVNIRRVVSPCLLNYASLLIHLVHKEDNVCPLDMYITKPIK